MYLNITRFFNEAGMIDYSASAAEIGQDVGKVTWQAALDDTAEWNLLTNAAELEAFADYAENTGGWTGEEIDRMSNQELQALCIQFVAGWIREAFPDGTEALSNTDWWHYKERLQQGECSGMLSRDSEGNVFCYFGI